MFAKGSVVRMENEPGKPKCNRCGHCETPTNVAMAQLGFGHCELQDPWLFLGALATCAFEPSRFTPLADVEI